MGRCEKRCGVEFAETSTEWRAHDPRLRMAIAPFAKLHERTGKITKVNPSNRDLPAARSASLCAAAHI
jgi:hypothetical protein